MKDYQKDFQRYWMFSDFKPKGRILKAIQAKIRQSGKKQIKKQIEDTNG